MNRRGWMLLGAAVLCLLLCGCSVKESQPGAAGEAASGWFSSPRRMGRGLAEVNGVVYGLSGYEGGFGIFTPAVERWSASGARERVGQDALLTSEIQGIDAVGDAMLITREEKPIWEVLSPTGWTLQPYLWDPATGRTVRMEQYVYAIQGRLWRSAEEGLQQLSEDGREVLAAWPGEVGGKWDTFFLLADGGRLSVLEIAANAAWDVTEMAIPLHKGSDAVVDGGVLYLLEETALTAWDLTDGTRRELLTFPAETYDAFVLDAERIILLGRVSLYQGNSACSAVYDREKLACSAVYDRETLACTLTFTHRAAATDALLTGDTLYLRAPYSRASIIDLTTGGEIWWELND